VNSSRFSRVFCEICNGLLQPHAYHLLIPRGFHIQLWVLKILCKVYTLAECIESRWKCSVPVLWCLEKTDICLLYVVYSLGVGFCAETELQNQYLSHKFPHHHLPSAFHLPTFDQQGFQWLRLSVWMPMCATTRELNLCENLWPPILRFWPSAVVWSVWSNWMASCTADSSAWIPSCNANRLSWLAQP
jgi:hypothetical protein